MAAAIGGLGYWWKYNQDKNNPYLQQDKQFPEYTLVKQDNFQPGQLYHPAGDQPPQDIAAVLHFKASKPTVGAALTFETIYDDRILIGGGPPPPGKTEFDIVLPRGYRDVPNHAVVRLINSMDPDRSEFKHWDLQPLPPPEKKATLPVKADPRISAERVAPNMIKLHLAQQPAAGWTAAEKVKWLATAPLHPVERPDAEPSPFENGTANVSTPAAIDQDSIDVAVYKVRQSMNNGAIDLSTLGSISWWRIQGRSRSASVETGMPAPATRPRRAGPR